MRACPKSLKEEEMEKGLWRDHAAQGMLTHFLSPHNPTSAHALCVLEANVYIKTAERKSDGSVKQPLQIFYEFLLPTLPRFPDNWKPNTEVTTHLHLEPEGNNDTE